MAPLDEEQPLLAKPAAGPVGRKALFVALALGFSLGVVAGVAGVNMNKVETETSLDNFRPEMGQSCALCIDYCNGVGGFECGVCVSGGSENGPPPPRAPAPNGGGSGGDGPGRAAPAPPAPGLNGPPPAPNGGGSGGDWPGDAATAPAPAPKVFGPAPAPMPEAESVSSLLDALADESVAGVLHLPPIIVDESGAVVDEIRGKVHDLLRTRLERFGIVDYDRAEAELTSPEIQDSVNRLVKSIKSSVLAGWADPRLDHETVSNLVDMLADEYATELTLVGVLPAKVTNPRLFETVRREIHRLLMNKVMMGIVSSKGELMSAWRSPEVQDELAHILMAFGLSPYWFN